MNEIVKNSTRFVLGLMFLFGLYVISYGHLLPGEGFDGGMIIAGVLILCMVVYGKEQTKKGFLNLSKSLKLSIIAGIILILIGFIGVLGNKKVYFDNFLAQGDPHNLFSGGIVPICNFVLGLLVGFGFYALFGYLVAFRRKEK
jgi:multicomponent Na+:H+ antiporter subunit B